MEKMRPRNELRFALAWITLYVVGMSLADGISERIGVMKSVTLPVSVTLSAFLFIWVRRNGLQAYYGLGLPKGMKGRSYLYFIPLLILSTSNLWNGVAFRFGKVETALYVISMCCVGFLEETIFRGLLFRALAKKSVKQAVVISSLTFGMGHAVNLLSGAGLLPTVLQMIYATAIGYLFTQICLKAGNLLPCIFTHAAINAMSAFAVKGSDGSHIISSAVLILISALYSVYLMRVPASSLYDGGSSS